MIDLKELPIKAIPFMIFPAAFLAFGELFVRIDPKTEIQTFVAFMYASISFVTGAFMTGSGFLFFTKCISNWPRMKGLDLK